MQAARVLQAILEVEVFERLARDKLALDRQVAGRHKDEFACKAHKHVMLSLSLSPSPLLSRDPSHSHKWPLGVVRILANEHSELASFNKLLNESPFEFRQKFGSYRKTWQEKMVGD